MNVSPFRRCVFVTLMAALSVAAFAGCAADPHKPHSKAGHSRVQKSDFPTAAEAGLAPTTSIVK